MADNETKTTPAAENAEPVQVRELGRQGPVREYSVRIAASYVERRVEERLASLGQSLRLPGFRPGRIPMGVMAQRYGARVRADVIEHLADELAPRAVPAGGMLSAVNLVGGLEEGDLALKVVATCLRDLPALDFSEMTLERLVLNGSNAEAKAMATSHLKRQVLDHLASAYDFPISPLLVERELHAIWKAAEAQLGVGSEDRGELHAEFARVAERRVRLGMVVAETARGHEIRVSDEEVGSARRSMSDEARAVEPPAQTLSRLLEEKVIAWIVSRAQVRERRATIEEVAEIAASDTGLPLRPGDPSRG